MGTFHIGRVRKSADRSLTKTGYTDAQLSNPHRRNGAGKIQTFDPTLAPTDCLGAISELIFSRALPHSQSHLESFQIQKRFPALF
jgi:hypothetical protein